MARPIATRFRIEGTLVAETPLHVGGATEAIATDLPLAVDGSGRFYIPGTSLAGALRNWMLDAFGPCFTRLLWGYTPERGDDPADGFASYVLIEDARVLTEIPAEIRDGVGIDRVEGRAADGIKYDRQVLPKGTRLSFEMTVEVSYLPLELTHGRPEEQVNRLKKAIHRDAKATAAALGHMLDALSGEGARLGAARTRGLGRVKLESPTVFEDDLRTPAGILDVLKGDRQPLDGWGTLKARDPAFAPKPRPRLDITMEWKPAGPVMVKADAAGVAVDMLPLVGEFNGGLAQIIPGSSIKGVLRAHAERIAATVFDKEADYDAAADRDRFINQLARCDLVETLFGAARKPARGDSGAAGVPLPGLGALSVEDCIAEARIDRAAWRRILQAGGGSDKKSMQPLLEELDGTANDGGPGWREYYPATHVAIDRWTGGAADGFLYSVLEPPVANAWPAIALSVALDRLADNRDRDFAKREGETDHAWEERQRQRAKEREEIRLAALALLFLTLRDFARGRIPLGFGGNRGLGAIEVESLTLKLNCDESKARTDLQALVNALKDIVATTFTREVFETPGYPVWTTPGMKLLENAWAKQQSATTGGGQ